MVIISEIITLTDLVTKATTLLLRLPDQWYKGTAEVKSFKSNLSILSQKTAQWKAQMNQFGMNEDPALNTFLNHAAKLLDEEDGYYEKHRKSRLWKLRRRLFPGRLSYILAEVLKIVEAGPELLKAGVEAHELSTKRLLMSPSPLPFGYDRKYVPLPGAVEKVQKALDDPEGPRVVTLYGEPGIGKSSLAKYVALLYQDSIRGSGPSSFDGVQYLFCGQESRGRIHQLQNDFLSNRGVAVTESGAIEGQKRDHQLFQNILRRLLVDQRLLIILDDVWKEDFEVLVNLICPGNGIKYLVTSQTRGIWLDALNIEVPAPDGDHALQILINHTEGLSVHRQSQSLGTNLKTEIREITEKLENHPLSLVNVAVSMNRHGATDPERWKVLAQNMYKHLDQNHFTGSILVYERPYSLSVSTSMMLMVESLRATERKLLCMVAMLEAEYETPEALIKYFFRRLYPTDASQFSYTYFSAVDYLENNSLVQVHRYAKGLTLGDCVEINVACVAIHNLRRQYIRQKRLPELQSIASTILARKEDPDRRCVNVSVRDSDQCLATVLSTLHFDDSLIDEVALQFQSVMTHMSGGVIPRGVKQRIDAYELVRGAKRDLWWISFYGMHIVAVELLNLQGDEGWKQKVRIGTTKIIMKLVCQQELEDESMASLLKMPQTTAIACKIFDCIYKEVYHHNLEHLFYFGEQRSLSDTHPQTWTALSDLWYKDLWYKDMWYKYVSYRELDEIPSRILRWMLEFEPKRTVLAEVQKLRQLADQSPDPVLRRIVEDGFLRLHGSRLTPQMLSGPDLDYLPTILWKLINDDDLLSSWELECMYQRALKCIHRDKGYVQILMIFPISCERWFTDSSLFRRLLRLERGSEPQSLLRLFLVTPEFEAKLVEILREDCWEEDFTRWPESYDGSLARFWGNVALVRDVHETTKRRLVKIAQRWIAKLTTDGASSCFCTCSCSNDGCGCRPKRVPAAYYPCGLCRDGGRVEEVTRTVKIINHFHGNSSMVIPLLQEARQNCKSHMGQAHAYENMSMYAEAVLYLNSAQQTFQHISAPSERISRHTLWYNTFKGKWRARMIFAKAMTKDYPASIELVNQYLNNDADTTSPFVGLFTSVELANRAVLFRMSGKFSEAIDDFDRSLKIWIALSSTNIHDARSPRLHYLIKYCLLRHRGYAKHLMGNHEGSTRDAKSALQLKENKLVVEPVSWGYYYSWKYSLLQLPIKDHEFLS